MSSREEELQEVITTQHEVIHEQANRINVAVDMLEELVNVTECDGYEIEKIIQVLMYGRP